MSQKKHLLRALCSRVVPLIEYASEDACDVALHCMRSLAEDVADFQTRLNKLDQCPLQELLALVDDEVGPSKKRGREAAGSDTPSAPYSMDASVARNAIEEDAEKLWNAETVRALLQFFFFFFFFFGD